MFIRRGIMEQVAWRSMRGVKIGGGGGAEDEPARLVVGLEEQVEKPEDDVTTSAPK